MSHTQGPSTSTPSAYAHALSLPIPIPNINQQSFRMVVDLNPSVLIGTSLSGTRNWISFTGGWFEGDFGEGVVM